MPPNHRIARHAQGKRVSRRLESEALYVHGHATLGVLLTGLRRACWDGTKQRNVHNAAAQLRQWRSDPQRPGLAGVRFKETLSFQRAHMIGGGPRTLESEMLRNLTQRRR